MLIDAAVDDQGVTLARTTLAAWDLIHGRSAFGAKADRVHS
jgi:LysR family glycine cleavage system transcriptional activator